MSRPAFRRRWVAVLAAAALATGGALATAGAAAADTQGTLIGTLLLPNGSVADNATIDVTPVDGGESVTTSTGFDGVWIATVPTGRYRVHFTQGDFSSYAFQARTLDAAAVLTVTDGARLQVDDTVLPAHDPGSIAGVIRGPGGVGLAGICVRAFPTDLGDDQPDPVYCADGGGVLTAAGGTFLVPDLTPGDYVLDVADPAGRYVRATTPTVTVGEGQAVTGVNVSLHLAGAITGVALDGSTRAPLADVCPYTYIGRHDGVPPVGQLTCSGADGRWSVTGLEPGTYTVLLLGDQDHARRFVGGGGKVESAKLLRPRAGRVTAVGDVPLYPGATVTGRVTDTAGKPVAGAWVNLGIFNAAAGPGEGQFTAQTDETGRYRIRNVPQMREIAEVYVDEQPYAWQWSGEATDPSRARPLDLRYGRTTTFDAVLQPEATLAVAVRGLQQGQAVDLRAISASGTAQIGFGGYADADGTVTLHNLPTGTVKVKGMRFPEPPVVFWYDGATSVTTATPVRVAAGTPTGITLTVPAS